MNQALLGETKHKLILGAIICLNCSQTNNEEALVLSGIRNVRIFQNEKVVHLFTRNSANFLYQTN